MKSFTSGKTSLSVRRMLFVLLAVAHAGRAEARVAVATSMVDASAIQVEEPQKRDQYLCLGAGWENVDPVVAQEIDDLKKVFPQMWIHLDESAANCFAPQDVPYSAQKVLDKVLARIDHSAGEQLGVYVTPTGSLVSPKVISPAKTEFEPQPIHYRNENAPFRKKLLWSSAVIGAADVATMVTLSLLPAAATQWSTEYNMWQNELRAWTHPPVFDHDLWTINYIGHPYAGSLYYNQIRSQGGTRLQSLLFAVGASTAWEYLIESVRERPSIQDLIVTPIGGAILGELSHMATERMKRNGYTTLEKVIVTIINPMDVLNNGYGK